MTWSWIQTLMDHHSPKNIEFGFIFFIELINFGLNGNNLSFWILNLWIDLLDFLFKKLFEMWVFLELILYLWKVDVRELLLLQVI